MGISDNPFLGPQWEGLGQALWRLFELPSRKRSFELQTYGLRYNLSPYTSPFFQTFTDDEGRVHLELSANLQVNPPLTDEQFAELAFYGWQLPGVSHDDDEEEGGNPNFLRVFPRGEDPLDIAEFILTTMVGVLGITDNDYFAFTPNKMSDLVASFEKLGRLKRSEGNPDGVIFALEGKHLDALDTKRPAGACFLKGPESVDRS